MSESDQLILGLRPFLKRASQDELKQAIIELQDKREACKNELFSLKRRLTENSFWLYDESDEHINDYIMVMESDISDALDELGYTNDGVDNWKPKAEVTT